MTNINVSDQQLQTLFVFLNRVQLQGSEVPAFINLINVLKSKALVSPKKTNNIKKEVNTDGKEDDNKGDKSRPTPIESTQN